MTENEIAKEIVNAAYKIHTTLGPGLFESVYETVMAQMDCKTKQSHAKAPRRQENAKYNRPSKPDAIASNEHLPHSSPQTRPR